MNMQLYQPQIQGSSFNTGGGGQLQLAGNNWDDELRRRMEMARQQGWSDDEINRSALIERGVRTAQSRQQQQQTQQPQQPKGAGRAGGLKGLALDLTPFGRVAEKLVNHEAGDISAGEIGMEALLSAVPFGAGRIIKGAKLAKGAITGVKAAENTAKVKGMSRAALRNSTIAPSSTLKTASEQQRLIDLTRSNPALRGSGRRKFQNVDGEVGKLADNVDELFKGVDAKVGTREFLDSIHNVRSKIVNPNELKRFDIEVDEAMQKTFGDKAPRLQGANARTLTVGGKPYQLVEDARNDALKHTRVAQSPEGKASLLMSDVFNAQPSHLADFDDIEKAFKFAPKGEKQVQQSFDKFKKLYAKDAASGRATPDQKLKIQNLPQSPKTFADTPEELFGGPIQKLSATDINSIRRVVNQQMDGIYKKQQAGTTLTDKDQAFLRVKDALDDQLNNLAPEGIRGAVRQNNLDMNTLIKARPEFKKLAEQKSTILGTDVPFVSQPIGQLFQAGSDYAGRVMTNGIARPAMQQAGTRMGADILGARNQFKPGQVEQPTEETPQEVEQLFQNPQNQDEAMLNDLFAGGALNDFDTAAQSMAAYQGNMMTAEDGTQVPASFYGSQGQQPQTTSSDLMNFALQALQSGDTNTYKTYAAAAKQLSEMEAAQAKTAQGSAKGSGSGLNVTKVTAQQFGLANSGMQALGQLQQMIQTDPSVVNHTATPGRQLPIVGGFVSNAAGTGQYDAVGYNIADAILRLRTGATANAGEVRNLQAQIMPRAGDSQATVQTKLQQIANIFQPTMQLAQQGGGGDSFEDEMMAMLTGGQQQNAYGY